MHVCTCLGVFRLVLSHAQCCGTRIVMTRKSNRYAYYMYIISHRVVDASQTADRTYVEHAFHPHQSSASPTSIDVSLHLYLHLILALVPSPSSTLPLRLRFHDHQLDQAQAKQLQEASVGKDIRGPGCCAEVRENYHHPHPALYTRTHTSSCPTQGVSVFSFVCRGLRQIL